MQGEWITRQERRGTLEAILQKGPIIFGTWTHMTNWNHLVSVLTAASTGFPGKLSGWMHLLPAVTQKSLEATTWRQSRDWLVVQGLSEATGAQRMLMSETFRGFSIATFTTALVLTATSKGQAQQISALRVGGASSEGNQWNSTYLDRSLIQFCFLSIIQVSYKCIILLC